MRKLRLTVCVMIFALLAACAPQSGEVNLPDKIPVQSPYNTESIAQHISTSPRTPEQKTMPISIDKNIPDITVDSAEKANSDYTLYEDADNIYYIWSGNGLYSINKSNGKATIIAGDCWCFTAYKGQLYFVDNTDELKQYNGTIDSIKPIVTMNKKIISLVCAGNSIYFTCSEDNDSEEYNNILFLSDLNVSNQVKLHDNVDTFCLYNNRVFSITMGELGCIQEFISDNTVNRQQLLNRSVYRNFDISLEKIICAEFKDDVFNCSNNLIYDINTGNTKDLSIAYAEYAVIGQYMIYISEDETDGQIIIKAYDFLADKEYALLDISDLADQYNNIEILTTRDSIYLCIENYGDHGLEMYEVIIRNGQAGLEHITSIAR